MAFNGFLIGREREEQFVKPFDVFPCFDRSVLRKVLREGKHQRLALVQHIDTLALRFGKAVRIPYGVTRNPGAQADKDNPEQAYLLE